MKNYDTPITVDCEIPKSELRHVRPMRGRFSHHRVAALLTDIYGEEEYKRMSDAGVDKRMMFGTNPHYQALVMGEKLCDTEGAVLVPKMPPSKAIAALVLPRMDEALDLAGEKDPSNQMNFTPQDDQYHGKLLHKYDEIVLAYASPTCSAHCRYCYRLDLFNKDTGKERIQPEELRDYVLAHNETLKENNGIDPETGEKRYPVREILLSGGDPLVLPNKLIYRYIAAAGEAKVHMLRMGTKEVAFRPERADEAFAGMLRIAHEKYPHMHINIVSHFTHPDEFLLRDKDGNYIPNGNGPGYQWMTISREMIQRLLSLPFLSIENQTPIISKVNDNVESLHILHEELRRMGIKPKYIFQGREIEGHKAFSIPVEQGWHLHNEAMKGISDAGRSRFMMSTEWGKMEIVAITDGLELTEDVTAFLPKALTRTLKSILSDGLVIFKSYRAPFEARTQGDLVIARRNPDALWISGYEDRIIYDSRRPDNDKYTSLLNLVLKAVGPVSYSRLVKDKGNTSHLHAAANDPRRKKERKETEKRTVTAAE